MGEAKWMRAVCPNAKCGKTFEFQGLAICPDSTLWLGKKPTTRFVKDGL